MREINALLLMVIRLVSQHVNNMIDHQSSQKIDWYRKFFLPGTCRISRTFRLPLLQVINNEIALFNCGNQLKVPLTVNTIRNQLLSRVWIEPTEVDLNVPVIGHTNMGESPIHKGSESVK